MRSTNLATLSTAELVKTFHASRKRIDRLEQRLQHLRSRHGMWVNGGADASSDRAHERTGSLVFRSDDRSGSVALFHSLDDGAFEGHDFLSD